MLFCGANVVLQPMSHLKQKLLYTRHSGESRNPGRVIMRSIFNFDPSDRVYVLDSGFRQNDGFGLGVKMCSALHGLNVPS